MATVTVYPASSNGAQAPSLNRRRLLKCVASLRTLCGILFNRSTHSDNLPMAQGKRVSLDIGAEALQSIKDLGAAAKQARLQAGEGQAAAAAKLGVHVQTIGRIESGEPGVAVGHVMGMLALYGLAVQAHAATPGAAGTAAESAPARAD